MTDGASAALITSEEYAKRLGLKAKVYLNEILFVAQDPKDELLLSPAYVIPKILKNVFFNIYFFLIIIHKFKNKNILKNFIFYFYI